MFGMDEKSKVRYSRWGYFEGRTSNGEVCCWLGVFYSFGFGGVGQAGGVLLRKWS